jgi:hypothetical protein
LAKRAHELGQDLLDGIEIGAAGGQHERRIASPPIQQSPIDSDYSGSALAVTLGQAVATAFAIGGADRAFNAQLHQALGGKADRLAQEIRVRGLLQKSLQGHCASVIAGSSVALTFATRLCRRTIGGPRKPLARYGTVESALRERLAPEALRRQWRRDLHRRIESISGVTEEAVADRAPPDLDHALAYRCDRGRFRGRP